MVENRQITYISLSSLKPYERNARTHSKDQISQIARSIEAFGFTNPVLVDGDGGIIAGHGDRSALLRCDRAQMAGLHRQKGDA